MICISGKSVSNKIASGPIFVFNNSKKTEFVIERSTDTAEEISILEKAISESMDELDALYEKALKEIGEEEAAIFEVHKMLLEDDGFIDDIKELIVDDNLKAYSAVDETAKKYSMIFAEMDDEYMSARSADVLDISKRVVSHILGTNLSVSINTPSIVFAYDLSPSETVSMDKSMILGFVTMKGSVNSHTAILARTMGIPAIVCADFDFDDVENGSVAIVDGLNSKVYLCPDEATTLKYNELINKQDEAEKKLSLLVGKETVTKSGKKINLYANIGNPEDAEFALKNDAEGIGLFRSEFLYIGKDKAPTEEEQYSSYIKVLEKMGDRPVIIRTLDIGADKKADYLDIADEENPALGLRAIRLCLSDEAMFRTQLRALLRAACKGNLYVMYPMITSVDEIERINVVVEKVKKELDEENISYRVPKQGIMIETPASAIISDELAKHVDFFSIGSNDLTQYTLAMDRQSEVLDSFFDPHHPAVLKLIKMTIDNAHDNGIWAGICGELAADTELTEKFVEMGVDELSVSPALILKIREKIVSLP